MGEQLRMFPLSTVLFPHATLRLQVFEPRYRVMTNECLAGDGRFGVVLISRGSEVGGGETRELVGTAAQIEEAAVLPDGRATLVVRGTDRFNVSSWLIDDPYPRGNVEWLEEASNDHSITNRLGSAEASVRRARALLAELRDVSVGLAEAPAQPGPRSWWLCDQAPVGLLDRQRLLECEDAEKRLELLEELVGLAADDFARLLTSG